MDAVARELEERVLALCEEHGYGRVMQVASELWRRKDPSGAIALGDCYGVIEGRWRRRRDYSREWRRRKRIGDEP